MPKTGRILLLYLLENEKKFLAKNKSRIVILVKRLGKKSVGYTFTESRNTMS